MITTPNPEVQEAAAGTKLQDGKAPKKESHVTKLRTYLNKKRQNRKRVVPDLVVRTEEQITSTKIIFPVQSEKIVRRSRSTGFGLNGFDLESIKKYLKLMENANEEKKWLFPKLKEFKEKEKEQRSKSYHQPKLGTHDTVSKSKSRMVKGGHLKIDTETNQIQVLPNSKTSMHSPFKLEGHLMISEKHHEQTAQTQTQKQVLRISETLPKEKNSDQESTKNYIHSSLLDRSDSRAYTEQLLTFDLGSQISTSNQLFIRASASNLSDLYSNKLQTWKSKQFNFSKKELSSKYEDNTDLESSHLIEIAKENASKNNSSVLQLFDLTAVIECPSNEKILNQELKNDSSMYRKTKEITHVKDTEVVVSHSDFQVLKELKNKKTEDPVRASDSQATTKNLSNRDLSRASKRSRNSVRTSRSSRQSSFRSRLYL